ncbi:hypothetical protein CAPTEDRAFT_185157 [Capitella teleta]|uniref:Peptidase M12B domain-containing protein n=1 Tax=Capitella teleta TaxID=283909 RepID=R7TH01_CAPTE|nr:hypothetical protein CAPTEDRAFT_185157 [Capitella teleta]|eukprot:ELT93093.1 hypothetical protein CAPTEDRAFT_185157 [Capitella teleta]
MHLKVPKLPKTSRLKGQCQASRGISASIATLKEVAIDDADTWMPRHLKLQLKMTSKSLDLNLTVNDFIKSMVPVVVGQENRFQPWTDPYNEDFAMYTDNEMRASVLCQGCRDGSRRTYMGTFQDGENAYSISPESGAWKARVGWQGVRDRRGKGGRRRKRSHVELLEEEEYVVEVVSAESGGSYEDDAARQPLEEYVRYERELMEYVTSTGNGIHKGAIYTVELLIVLDFAIYKYWFNKSLSSTTADRHRDAVNSIRFYYAHVVNGIDMRYRSISNSEFSIRVALAGYYIAATSEASPFTEGWEIRERDETLDATYTHAYKALDAFQEWLERDKSDLPFFDHAALITGNILFGGYYLDGTRRHINGLSDIKGVCTRRGASVSKEGGSFRTSQTVTHELGHNLGAYHDGTGTNPCDGSDQFIMAPAPGELNEENKDNVYKFSDCSIAEFRDYLSLIRLGVCEGSAYRMQMLQPGKVNANSLSSSFSFYVLMQIIVGREIFVGHFQTEIRALQWLKTLLGDAILINTDSLAVLRASEYVTTLHQVVSLVIDSLGARVGRNRLTAIRNHSESNVAAHVNVDRWRFQVVSTETKRLGVQLCTGQLATTAKASAVKRARNMKLANQVTTHRPGCEYGDRASWCSSRRQSECYNNHTNEFCCDFCQKHETGIAGCEYGDKSAFCSRDDCHRQETWQKCCFTCQREAGWSPAPTTTTTTTTTNIPTTEPTTTPYATIVNTSAAASTVESEFDSQRAERCVNSATWCFDLKAPYCYTTHEICCETCRRYSTHTPGCEFGDRFTWCATIDDDNCMFASYQQDCCLSCAAGNTTWAPIVPGSPGVPGSPRAPSSPTTITVSPSSFQSTTTQKQLTTTSQGIVIHVVPFHAIISLLFTFSCLIV